MCITDEQAAAAREAQMLAARASGQAPAGRIAYPPEENGVIALDSAGAGS